VSESNQYVFLFSGGRTEGDPQRRDILGGKGASLASMSRAGLPVPPGFTISAQCCRFVLDHDGRWPPGLEEQVRRAMRELEAITHRSFGRGKNPLLVAVRSGAAESMPGMMDTILNCGLHPGLADEVGDPPAFWRAFVQFLIRYARSVAGIPTDSWPACDTPSREVAERYMALYRERAGRPFPMLPWDSLVECINAVFLSWESERAKAYRRERGFGGQYGTAVNVQAMFPSQVSGILFTVDPNDPSAERMVVESSHGLGESVVSGDSAPDRFVLRRNSLEVLESHIGAKGSVVVPLGGQVERPRDEPSLSPVQLAELGRLGLRVEELYGVPVDIEWGWADSSFVLLQARPIRGLDVARDVEIGRQEEIARLRAMSAGKRRVWVAHNLGETLRAPTPLTWDIIRTFMTGAGGFGRLYRDFGFRPSRRVCEDGFLELICGRIYADPDRLAELFWDGLPLVYDLDKLLLDRSVLDRAPDRFDPDKTDSRFLVSIPLNLLAMVRSARRIRKAMSSALATFREQVLPPYLRYVEEARQRSLAQLDAADLIAELDARRRIFDEFGKESLKPGFLGGLAFARLEALLVQLLGPGSGAELARRLTSGLDGDVTIEQNELLFRIARGEGTFEEFLQRFGHRAFGEMELAIPRWREDPSALRRLMDVGQLASGRSPAELHRANAESRRQAEAELPAMLARWGGSSFLEEIVENLHAAQHMLPFRETGKHYLMMSYELIRLAALELGRRWGLGDGVFFLRLDELRNFEAERARLTGEIEQRQIRWRSAQRLDMPDLIDSASLDGLGLPSPCEAAASVSGTPVAPGIATGRACVICELSAARTPPGEFVLVCPSTDPAWAPLLVRAEALIVERGGVLSHGAIVARDLGIPAVVCPGAARRFRDGQSLRVDGNTGTISVLDESGSSR